MVINVVVAWFGYVPSGTSSGISSGPSVSSVEPPDMIYSRSRRARNRVVYDEFSKS